MSKIFTVYGATGQQGGSLIKYLLDHPRFSKTYTLRGVTRDVTKASAKALADRGVEVVEGDLSKPETLKAATAGSYAVFAVTNYWDQASATVEVAQGKAIADAAVEAKASLLIWSSLPRIGLPNFDSKADVEVYIRELPIKSVYFMPGWFMQNQLHFAKPKKTGEKTYVWEKPFPTPEASPLVPLIDIKDIGKYVQPFLDDPEKYNQASLTAATKFYTPEEMCEDWTKVTGNTVSYDNLLEDKEISKDENASLDSTYYGAGSRAALDWTLAQMEEKPTTWEQFVKDEEPWFA